MIVSALMMSHSFNKSQFNAQVKDDSAHYFCLNNKLFENESNSKKPEHSVYDFRFLFALKEDELQVNSNNFLKENKFSYNPSFDLRRNYLQNKKNNFYNRMQNK